MIPVPPHLDVASTRVTRQQVFRLALLLGSTLGSSLVPEASAPSDPCSAVVRISELGLDCAGGEASPFIELTSTADQPLSPGLRVRVPGVVDGQEIFCFDRGYLIASHPDSTLWRAGRSWLFGGSSFGFLSGLEPDKFLPTGLPRAGTITLYDYHPDCGFTLVDEIRYGSAGHPPAPAPGRSLERQPNGTLLEEPDRSQQQISRQLSYSPAAGEGWPSGRRRRS